MNNVVDIILCYAHSFVNNAHACLFHNIAHDVKHVRTSAFTSGQLEVK